MGQQGETLLSPESFSGVAALLFSLGFQIERLVATGNISEFWDKLKRDFRDKDKISL